LLACDAVERVVDHRVLGEGVGEHRRVVREDRLVEAHRGLDGRGDARLLHYFLDGGRSGFPAGMGGGGTQDAQQDGRHDGEAHGGLPGDGAGTPFPIQRAAGARPAGLADGRWLT